MLNTTAVQFSEADKIKEIKIPNVMSPELAEEIGVHLGDGCMSKRKNYFSVKTNKIEKDYMVEFLFPLYKKIYNLSLKLMCLPSVSGFEICSRGLCEFKNKALNLPYGEKIHKIEIPHQVLDSRNKEIYRACIRGLFDTDGHLAVIKSKNNYPTISITIKSEKLILQVKEMLTNLGFIVYAGKWVININGRFMVEKWRREIGSNNPKNQLKLEQT
ncbi:MAG: LAGLIDADG family homing endonuclease, partial [Nanoarchaeota archaeon]